MSSFGTFLTSGPNSSRRGKVDLHQRFLRETNKHFPKAIRPKVNVNVNPVVQYMSNQQNQKQETGFQTTMKYKNCSQIVPTMGLTNLVFYDCLKNKRAARPIDDSISPLKVPSSSLASEDRCYESERRKFVAPQLVMESNRFSFEIGDDVTNISHEWMDNNFDEFASVPLASGGSHQDFTLTSNATSNVQDFTLTSNVFAPDADSYTSFEMNLNRLAHDQSIISVLRHSDILPFELDLDLQADPLSTGVERADYDSFEANLNQQDTPNMSGVIDTDSLNAAGLGSLLKSPDYHMTSHSEDESMEKFGVSSCNISLDISVERDRYADFVPLHTSTPVSRSRVKARQGSDHHDSDRDHFLFEDILA